MHRTIFILNKFIEGYYVVKYENQNSKTINN